MRIELLPVSRWSKKKCFKRFFELLENRIEVRTALIQNEDTGFVDKQVLIVSCDGVETISQASTLPVPLKVVTAEDIGKENIN